MALNRNMTQTEMVDFIDKELIPQVKSETGIWIHSRKRNGGYFVVTRQILCMVDFLGAVYSGYTRSENRADPNGRRIATSAKAKSFILRFFEPKSTYTSSSINILYDMYRNGLVHLYQPKIIKYNSKKRLQWFFYRGKRFHKTMQIDTPIGKVKFSNVSHLQTIFNNPNKKAYYFPIGVDCLYEDFEKAVLQYRDKLKSTKYLQTNWRTAVNAICKPR